MRKNHPAPTTLPAPPAPRPEPGLWARQLSHLLDDVIHIPGTRIGVGLDAILGFLLPVLGDTATGVTSALLLLEALRRKVPTVVILRMLLNIGVDVVGGMLPVAGDAFDLLFQSNRRNLDLMDRAGQPGLKPKATAADYLVVGLGLLLAASGVVLPVLALYLLGLGGLGLFGWLFGGPQGG